MLLLCFLFSIWHSQIFGIHQNKIKKIQSFEFVVTEPKYMQLRKGKTKNQFKFHKFIDGYCYLCLWILFCCFNAVFLGETVISNFELEIEWLHHFLVFKIIMEKTQSIAEHQYFLINKKQEMIQNGPVLDLINCRLWCHSNALKITKSPF